MKSGRNRLLRYAGILGIAGPLTGALTVVLAIHYSPWFSWTGNYLSDLGGDWGASEIWTSRGNAGLIFNIGIFLTGLMGAGFSALIIKSGVMVKKDALFGVKLLFVSMLGLTGVGLFPETTGPLHILSALTFFMLSPIALIATGRGLNEGQEERFPRIVMSLGGVSFLLLPLLLLPHPYGGNAIAEALTALPVGVCIFITGVRMLWRN